MYLRGFQFAELGPGELLQSPDVCDLCGREELKRTIKLINPDGRVVWFGAGCAAKAMGIGIKAVQQAKRDAERAVDDAERAQRRGRDQAEDAQWQAFLDRHAPGHLDWQGKPDRFAQIQALGGMSTARALSKQDHQPNTRKTTPMPRRPARAIAKPKSDTITEEDVQAAFDILNRDYWDDVRGVVKDLEEHVERGEITDQDRLEELMNQFVEGTQRVIYTFQAKIGMLCTNNADAYQEFGFDMSDGIDWSKLMFCAMVEDVRAACPDFAFDE